IREVDTSGCFAVPAAIFELLAQELLGQRVVRFLEIRADPEDSAVDAGLRLPVKERPVVERLKHNSLLDKVDHFAGLPAGRVEPQVLQDDERVEGYQQAAVLFRPAPVAGSRLASEKFGSPPFGCHTRSLGSDGAGGLT